MFSLDLEKFVKVFLQTIHHLLIHLDPLFGLPDNGRCDHFSIVSLYLSLCRYPVYIVQRLLEVIEAFSCRVNFIFKSRAESWPREVLVNFLNCHALHLLMICNQMARFLRIYAEVAVGLGLLTSLF